jgi:hypothetical protein
LVKDHLMYGCYDQSGRSSNVTDVLREVADLRRSMSAAARQEAERHTWEAVFDRLMDCYERLASQWPRLPAVAGEETAL